MPQGQIIRALSSFYYVEDQDKIWECKARGIFKKRQQSPLVGDLVEFEITENNQGIITKMMPRKNELIRPPISNVDQAILVFSLKEPNFSSLLLDRFLVHVENANISPIICLTKTDLHDYDKEIEEELQAYVSMGYSVLFTNKSGVGMDILKENLKDKISVFSGQSGVGKSTLLNTLLPELGLETSNISHKLGRGKHTTRMVQLIHLPEGGMVADTPGFSQLDFHDVTSQELGEYFREIHSFSENCRFRGCLHLNEPGCAVKAAVNEKIILQTRYNHYLEFLTEIKTNEDNKWR